MEKKTRIHELGFEVILQGSDEGEAQEVIPEVVKVLAHLGACKLVGQQGQADLPNLFIEADTVITHKVQGWVMHLLPVEQVQEVQDQWVGVGIVIKEDEYCQR